MGFYFRKSIGFGPFRLNFSKSGIGVSAGVRGARVSTGPRGTYINAGTHGFYYRQKINTGGSRPSQPPPISPQQQHYFNPVSHDAHQIHSADVSSFVNTSNAKLIEQINEASNQMRFAPFFGVVTGVVAIILFLAAAAVANGAVGSSALTNGIGIIVAMILVISGGSYLTWRVHNGDQLKRTTPLFYELEYEAVTNFEKTKRAIQVLSRSARIWRVQTQQSNWDWKRNAGAS